MDIQADLSQLPNSRGRAHKTLPVHGGLYFFLSGSGRAPSQNPIWQIVGVLFSKSSRAYCITNNLLHFSTFLLILRKHSTHQAHTCSNIDLVLAATYKIPYGGLFLNVLERYKHSRQIVRSVHFGGVLDSSLPSSSVEPISSINNQNPSFH